MTIVITSRKKLSGKRACHFQKQTKQTSVKTTNNWLKKFQPSIRSSEVVLQMEEKLQTVWSIEYTSHHQCNRHSFDQGAQRQQGLYWLESQPSISQKRRRCRFFCQDSLIQRLRLLVLRSAMELPTLSKLSFFFFFFKSP